MYVELWVEVELHSRETLGVHGAVGGGGAA